MTREEFHDRYCGSGGCDAVPRSCGLLPDLNALIAAEVARDREAFASAVAEVCARELVNSAWGHEARVSHLRALAADAPDLVARAEAVMGEKGTVKR